MPGQVTGCESYKAFLVSVMFLQFRHMLAYLLCAPARALRVVTNEVSILHGELSAEKQVQ